MIAKKMFFKLKFLPVLLFSLMILQITAISAEQKPRKALTLQILRNLKDATLKGRRKDFNQDLSKLVYAVPADEKVILEFIREDLLNAQTKYSADELEQLDRLFEKILVVLEKIGTGKSVPVLIDWMAKWKWNEEICPLSQAKTLLIISERFPVTKDQMKPLLENKDPKMAELAKEMWNIISYQDIPSNLDNVVYSGISYEKGLVREAGVMNNWEAVAKEQGYDLSGDTRVKSLSELVINTKKRLAELQDQFKTGKLKRAELIHTRSRLNLLRLRAIQNLIKLNRDAAFDLLVKWIDTSDSWDSLNAAYFLFELTGKNLPVIAYFDYGNLRNSTFVNHKAADAWRKWRKQHKKLPVPDNSAVNIEKRLTTFEMDQRRKEGVEYKRPVDEVITELLNSKNRRILDMLVKVLAEKTLTKDQIKRITDASGKDESEAHRKYLLKVLSASGDTSAEDYVASVINKSTPDNRVIEYVSSLNKIGISEMDLLEELYKNHKSEKVRNTIADRVFTRDYSKEVDEEIQNRFVKFLLKNSKNDKHKLSGLMLVYNRAGVNRTGRKMVLKTLETEKSPQMRQAVFKMLLEKDAEAALPILLSPKESTETKLAGLAAYKRNLQLDPPTIAFIDDEIKILRQGMKEDTSEKVKKAINEIIGIFRKMEIKEKLKRLKRRHIALAIKEQLNHRKTSDKEKKAIKQQLEYMRRQFESSIIADRIIESIKEKYGDLPEEKEIKAEFAEIQKQQLSEVDKALKLLQ